jgi:malate/lactate dehydrogenase
MDIAVIGAGGAVGSEVARLIVSQRLQAGTIRLYQAR